MKPSFRQWTALLVLGSAAFSSAQTPPAVTIHGTFPTVGLIQSELAGGARQLRFRELVLTDAQVSRLMDPEFLRQVSEALSASADADRFEVQVETVQGRSFHLAIDRRGELLKARIAGARFASARDAKRLLKRLKTIFAALEIRGTDGDDRALRLAAHRRGVDEAEPLPELESEPTGSMDLQQPGDRAERPDRPDVERREQAFERVEPMQTPASAATPAAIDLPARHERIVPEHHKKD